MDNVCLSDCMKSIMSGRYLVEKSTTTYICRYVSDFYYFPFLKVTFLFSLKELLLVVEIISTKK